MAGYSKEVILIVASDTFVCVASVPVKTPEEHETVKGCEKLIRTLKVFTRITVTKQKYRIILL